MDFGANYHNYDQLGASLPPDHAINSISLPGFPEPTAVRIGLAQWARKEYIGPLYPKGTRDRDFLTIYSRFFSVIELNSTAYAIPAESQVHKWVEKVHGQDFLFCPKVPHSISRYGLDNQSDTELFIKSIRNFSGNLGPAFLQLTDRFAPSQQGRLLNFLGSWPADIQLFLELRHSGWFETEIYSKLQGLGIGLVITDTPGHRELMHMALPIPKLFLRFAGKGGHPKDLDRMREWANRISTWKEAGLKEAFIFLQMQDPAFDISFHKQVQELFS